MVADFLPNIRGLVSHELYERKESQRKIASLLGITQARVSYYLGTRKSKFVSELSTRFGLSQGEVQSYGQILAEDVRRSEVDGIFTLYSIWRNLLFTGGVCSVHQRDMGVTDECSVCMELQRPSRESSENSGNEDTYILREVTEATGLIESSAAFPGIMPEVSVNIAMSRKTLKSSRDVAAIPGRINRIHGRAKALMLPEFGSSKHMSNVLIILHSKEPSLNSIMNLKYDKAIDEVISGLAIARIFTRSADKTSSLGFYERSDYTKNHDPVLERLSKTSIPRHVLIEPSPFAIIDRGSEGLEPMTYLVGRKATDVAHAALKIAHDYTRIQTV